MMDKPKNPEENLTTAHLELVEKAALNYLLSHYALIYNKNPKKYAQEFYKSVKSDAILLKILGLFAVRDSSSKTLKPEDFKKFMDNRLNNSLNPDLAAKIADQLQNISKKFNSRALNEKVLTKLAGEGVITNYQGEELFKKVYPRRRGRESVSGIEEDRGGKRSFYLIKEEITMLKEVLKNPSALEYMNSCLLKSGILQKILSFVMATVLYTIKLDEQILNNILFSGLEITGQRLTHEDINDIPNFVNQIMKMTDEQIELASATIASMLIKDKQYLNIVVPLFGFINLDR